MPSSADRGGGPHGEVSVAPEEEGGAGGAGVLECEVEHLGNDAVDLELARDGGRGVDQRVDVDRRIGVGVRRRVVSEQPKSRRGAVPLPHGERPAEEVAGALRVAAGLVQRGRTLERQPLEVGEPACCRYAGGVEEACGGVEPAGAGGALGRDQIEERPMVTGVRLRPALQQPA